MDLVDKSTSDPNQWGQLRIRERTSIASSRLKARILNVITLHTLLNAIFVLGVSSLCLRQCYSQISEYLLFNTRVQLTHDLPSNAVFLLPGVTICNNNRVRLDRLAREIPAVQKDVDKLLRETSSSVLSEKRRIELLTSVRKAIDGLANVTEILIESPIEKLLEMSRSSMIIDINCNTAWGEQINCENLKIVESYQGSACSTAFYLGSLLEALSSGMAFDFKTRLINGSRKVDSFQSHEMGEILINFDPLQHGDMYQDVGGKVAVHSTAHIGSIKDVSHTILPGHRYELILARSMSKRLPPPYDTRCLDYKYSNSPKFYNGHHPSPSIELDKTTCIRNCITKKTTQICNCWPVEVPWYPGDPGGSYRLCSWGFDEVNAVNFSSTEFVNCYRKFYAICRDGCRPGCRTEDYSVQIISNPWPDRDRFLAATSYKEIEELSRLKACCSLISIKYWELMERRNIMIPTMTLAQLVSNIGGIVSAMVGVSSLTIYRYITRRVFHCKAVGDSLPLELANLPDH